MAQQAIRGNAHHHMLPQYNGLGNAQRLNIVCFSKGQDEKFSLLSKCSYHGLFFSCYFQCAFSGCC